jgi:hypothetical protein
VLAAKHYVYTFIGQRPIRSLKAKIRALTHRTSQQELGFLLARLNQVMHGGELLQHAFAKNIFNMLDNFTWWGIIRMLRVRHHWRWNDVRRRSSTQPAGGIQSRQMSRVAPDCGDPRQPVPLPGATSSPHLGFNQPSNDSDRGARCRRWTAMRPGPDRPPTPRTSGGGQDDGALSSNPNRPIPPSAITRSTTGGGRTGPTGASSPG